VIAGVASGVLGNHPIDFQKFKDHNSIRKAIAETIPGFEKIADLDITKEEFQIKGRTIHEPSFPTADKKASFKVVPIPESKSILARPFKLMSVRSEGQFNTIVYEEEDLWRGQTERWVVLMNPADMKSLGLNQNDRVTLESEVGKMTNVKVREFDIKTGNVIGYYPETNVLIASATDPRSLTPAFKNTPITIRPE
jgi:anaerobic selenocysteine-containing dehydrogenase